MGNLVRQLGSIEQNLNKNEIIELASDNAKSIIENGKYDLLRVYIELKRYETYLKSLIQNLKKSAQEKATEFETKSFKYNSARVNISKRTKWDFSVDKKWSDLNDQLQRLTQEKKEREKYLKEKKESKIVDKETGEIIESFVLPKEIDYGLTIRL